MRHRHTIELGLTDLRVNLQEMECGSMYNLQYNKSNPHTVGLGCCGHWIEYLTPELTNKEKLIPLYCWRFQI